MKFAAPELLGVVSQKARIVELRSPRTGRLKSIAVENFRQNRTQRSEIPLARHHRLAQAAYVNSEPSRANNSLDILPNGPIPIAATLIRDWLTRKLPIRTISSQWFNLTEILKIASGYRASVSVCPMLHLFDARRCFKIMN